MTYELLSGLQTIYETSGDHTPRVTMTIKGMTGGDALNQTVHRMKRKHVLKSFLSAV